MLFTASSSSSSSSFYFLPSCASLFSAFPDFLIFFCHQEFCLFTSILRTLRVSSAAAEVQTCSFRCSRDLDGSERAARAKCCGRRVETWASAKVRSRPGMQPGSERARSVVGESRPGCNEQANAKICSRPGCNEQANAKICSRPGCNEQASAKICSRPVRRDLDGSSVKSASALHAAHAKKT